jgi:hypothetical protein
MSNHSPFLFEKLCEALWLSAFVVKKKLLCLKN